MKKCSFKMLGLSFTPKLDWGSYWKLEPQFVLWRFFLLRLLCISINLSYSFAWNTFVMSGLVLLSPSCYLELLHRLWKWICWTFVTLLPLLNPWLIVESSIFNPFIGITLCLSELAQLVPFSYFRGKSTYYFDRLHDFSVTFLHVIRMTMSSVSFLVQLDSGILCLI